MRIDRGSRRYSRCDRRSRTRRTAGTDRPAARPGCRSRASGSTPAPSLVSWPATAQDFALGAGGDFGFRGGGHDVTLVPQRTLAAGLPSPASGSRLCGTAGQDRQYRNRWETAVRAAPLSTWVPFRQLDLMNSEHPIDPFDLSMSSAAVPAGSAARRCPQQSGPTPSASETQPPAHVDRRRSCGRDRRRGGACQEIARGVP